MINNTMDNYEHLTLSADVALYGRNSLSYADNMILFKSVYTFTEKTKRF